MLQKMDIFFTNRTLLGTLHNVVKVIKTNVISAAAFMEYIQQKF